MSGKLTDKQRLFVEEYLIDLNATAAARRAGYSAKTAEVIGFENLRKPNIAAAIGQAKAERSERTEITQDWVLEGLKENYRRAMQQEAVLDAEGNSTGEYRYNGAVANKSLELMGRHLNMFTDTLNLSGGVTVTHEEALRMLNEPEEEKWPLTH